MGRRLKLPLPGCDKAPKFRIRHLHVCQERLADFAFAKLLLGSCYYALGAAHGVKYLERKFFAGRPLRQGRLAGRRAAGKPGGPGVSAAALAGVAVGRRGRAGVALIAGIRSLRFGWGSAPIGLGGMATPLFAWA
jgi:hypothetical protein